MGLTGPMRHKHTAYVFLPDRGRARVGAGGGRGGEGRKGSMVFTGRKRLVQDSADSVQEAAQQSRCKVHWWMLVGSNLLHVICSA